MVFTAFGAILLEQTKDSIIKQIKPFNDLFKEHDVNKKGLLEYAHFENLLLSCQIAFKPNAFSQLV